MVSVFKHFLPFCLCGYMVLLDFDINLTLVFFEAVWRAVVLSVVLECSWGSTIKTFFSPFRFCHPARFLKIWILTFKKLKLGRNGAFQTTVHISEWLVCYLRLNNYNQVYLFFSLTSCIYQSFNQLQFLFYRPVTHFFFSLLLLLIIFLFIYVFPAAFPPPSQLNISGTHL